MTPVYVLKCQKCGKTDEVFTPKYASDFPDWKCPHCGNNQYKKVITPTNFLLQQGKVGGFYKPSVSSRVGFGFPKDHPMHPDNRDLAQEKKKSE